MHAMFHRQQRERKLDAFFLPKSPRYLPGGGVGGLAHLFPPFFLFWQEIFTFLDGLTVSCVTINRTDKQQTASNFSTPWKSPPPHDCKIAFSFQRRLLINSLIGNSQCTYFSIVRALTISNLCFSCSCGRPYKKTLFSERSSTMRTMKTSSCSLHLPFHNTAMAQCRHRGDHHHALFLPCMSPLYTPLLGRAGR
jgi:hypothetical protein